MAISLAVVLYRFDELQRQPLHIGSEGKKLRSRVGIGRNEFPRLI
jgi:hypothetical protein